MPFQAGISGLHKLHLDAGQFKQVSIFQGDRLGLDGRAVQGGLLGAIDVGHDETVWTPRDRSNGNARLANGRDHFDQRHFAPRCRTVEYANRRSARLVSAPGGALGIGGAASDGAVA